MGERYFPSGWYVVTRKQQLASSAPRRECVTYSSVNSEAEIRNPKLPADYSISFKYCIDGCPEYASAHCFGVSDSNRFASLFDGIFDTATMPST